MSLGVWVRSLGAVTAAGVGVEALRQALLDPTWRPALGIERPDAEPLPVATCSSFSPRDHLPPMVARRLDRPARLLVVAAREALAALDELDDEARQRVGVATGTWTAGTQALFEVLRTVFLVSPEEAPPAQFPATVANAPAGQLGILEHLGGPNLTFAEKQVGGLRALAEAARVLRGRRADAMVAGGVDEAHWLNAESYSRLGVTAQGSRPGMTLGEGAAVLLLRPQSVDALAQLAGWASASTPCPPYRYPDTSDAVVTAARQALAAAGATAGDVDLVVYFANGMSNLAALETHALDELLGARRPAALTVSTRLGEGAFSAALRAMVATLAVAGRLDHAWTPDHLAAAGFPPLSGRARCALVCGVAGGGSAVALVITAP